MRTTEANETKYSAAQYDRDADRWKDASDAHEQASARQGVRRGGT